MQQDFRPLVLGPAIALLIGCGEQSKNGFEPEPLPDLDSVLTIEPGDTALLVTGSFPLRATLLDPDSQPIPSFAITYQVIDPEVARVSLDGTVTGLHSGQTLVVGAVGGATDSARVTVPMSFGVISAGASTCGVTTDNQARCWGWGDQGELGADRAEFRPVTPDGGHSFTLIRTSPGLDFTFTCGLTLEGAAYCWGNNAEGQLGTGDLLSLSLPRKVLSDQVFVDLDLGYAHACAMTDREEVFCWGSNEYGQLGTGDSTSSNQPIAVATDMRFVSLTLGGSHSCGLLDSGLAYCWGDGSVGQLGAGDTQGSPLPSPVQGGHRFMSLDGGAWHTCGIATNGDALCWGRNIFGEVGNGGFFFDEPVPSPSLVVGGHSWSAISAGVGFTCGITLEGPSYCWGIDDNGRLGNDSPSTGTQRPSPQLVVGDYSFVGITAGYDQACAISGAPGRPLYCWGRNNRGQLDGYPGDWLSAAAFKPRLTTGF
jgi:alpha-tubulin suppressor-like RCC1 family protein